MGAVPQTLPVPCILVKEEDNGRWTVRRINSDLTRGPRLGRPGQSIFMSYEDATSLAEIHSKIQPCPVVVNKRSGFTGIISTARKQTIQLKLEKVYELLSLTSRELHELEELGSDLSDPLDRLWSDITAYLEWAKESDSPYAPPKSAEVNMKCQKCGNDHGVKRKHSVTCDGCEDRALEALAMLAALTSPDHPDFEKNRAAAKKLGLL